MSVIRNPGLVFKSTCPDKHLAIVEANTVERDRLTSAQIDLARSLVPTGVAYGVNHDSTAAFMTGIKVASRDGIEVPPGMRWDTKAKRGQHILVPAKKTDEGKALARQFDALDFQPKSLGAVSKILVISNGVHDYFSSAVIEVIGADVYATYHYPLRDGAHDRGVVDADPDWAEIPLSEFYAAREQAAAGQAAA